MDPDFDKYDVFGAVDGADAYDVSQGIGAAAEQTLRSVGSLLGGETGVEITNTAIDGIHYAAKSAAHAMSGLLDWIGL